MNTKLSTKAAIFGFFTWLIPFVVSIFFFNKQGELQIDHDLFKSIMIVVGSLSGCYFIYRFFKLLSNEITCNYISSGIYVGVSWFILNIILDFIVLVPMMKVSFAKYFTSIGLGYLVIPITTITVGLIVDQKQKKSVAF